MLAQGTWGVTYRNAEVPREGGLNLRKWVYTLRKYIYTFELLKPPEVPHEIGLNLRKCPPTGGTPTPCPTPLPSSAIMKKCRAKKKKKTSFDML